MPELAYKPFRGKTIRLTSLVEDCCQLPAEDTTCSIAVFDSFTTVSIEANIEDGDTAFERKANGDICINERDDDVLQDLTVNLTMCNVLPSAVSMLTGWPTVTDADGNVVGFDIMEGSSSDQTAVEIFSGVSGLDCGDGAKYGYNVLPCTSGWTLADTIEWAGIDTITSITLVGRTKGNHDYGTGPYAVQLDDGGDPGALVDPIQSGAHARIMVTDVPPPAVTDGCVAASAANGYLFGPESI